MVGSYHTEIFLSTLVLAKTTLRNSVQKNNYICSILIPRMRMLLKLMLKFNNTYIYISVITYPKRQNALAYLGSSAVLFLQSASAASNLSTLMYAAALVKVIN